mmetsp:Transcript_50398/g.144889  ORF Transcript_50398/g.144889 Transcript_50398/m.144889 type:complete len:213 (+) Transcript_50398:933-1571(+)
MLLIELNRQVHVHGVQKVHCTCLRFPVAENELKPHQDRLHVRAKQLRERSVLAEVGPKKPHKPGHVRLGTPKLIGEQPFEERLVERFHAGSRIQEETQNLERVGQEIHHVPLEDLPEHRKQHGLNGIGLHRHADFHNRCDRLKQVVVEHRIRGVVRHGQQNLRQWSQGGQAGLGAVLLQEAEYPGDSTHQILVHGDPLARSDGLQDRIHNLQ